MATRNERRRRQRQEVRKSHSASHGDIMLASVVKSKDSRQIAPKQDPFTDLYDEGKAVAPPYPLGALLELAKVNAVHSACIEAKVADSVGRGWKLTPEDDTEDGTDDDTDKVTRVLTDRLKEICPKLPFKALLRQAVRELEKTGWGLIEVAREGDDIAGLFPMPPQNMRATKDDDVLVQVVNDKKVFFMRYGAGPKPGVRGKVSSKNGCKDWEDSPIGKQTQVADEDVANEVIVLMHYSEETPYYGVPPWVSGVPSIAELTAIREFNVSFFESGGQADRLIHVSGGTGDNGGPGLEAAKKLAEDLGVQIDDSRGRAHLSLLSYGAEGLEVEVTPLSEQGGGKRDRAFSQGREDLSKELLVAHQTPASRIAWSIVGALGGENAGEELDAYRYGVVEPLQELTEDELNRTIFNPKNGGLDLIPGYLFAFVELDWTNLEEKRAQVESMVDRGMATPNQGRVMLGEDESDDPRADLLYYKGVPLGTTAMGTASDTAGAEGQAQNVLAELRDAVRTALNTHEQAQTAAATDDTETVEKSVRPVRLRIFNRRGGGTPEA